MDHFSPGIRALRRSAARINHHVRLFFAERNVAKAETELGLLGWQQAEFDRETQRQVDALQNVEREQAELQNRSAEIAHGLAEVAQERATLRSTFDQEYGALEASRNKAREPLAAMREQVHKLRDASAAAERRGAELEKELREIDKVYNKLLLVQPQTSETRDEILGIREQLIAVPNELNDIRTQTARWFGEVHVKEEQIAKIEQRTAEIDRQMRERKAAFHHEDDILARKQRDLERDKKRAQAEADQLERAKINPYREIGRVLADNSIAPMNQPQALERVTECRAIVTDHYQSLLNIDAVAAAEDRIQVRMSLTIWAAICLVIAVIVAALV